MMQIKSKILAHTARITFAILVIMLHSSLGFYTAAAATPCKVQSISLKVSPTSLSSVDTKVKISVTANMSTSPPCDYDVDLSVYFKDKNGVEHFTTDPFSAPLSRTSELFEAEISPKDLGFSTLATPMAVNAVITDNNQSSKEFKSSTVTISGGTTGGGGTGGTGGTNTTPPTQQNLGELINLSKYKTVPQLVFAILNYGLMFIGVIAVIMIIYGGFLMVMSAGNEERLTQGKKTVMWAIGGLVVALMAFSIVSIVQNLL